MGVVGAAVEVGQVARQPGDRHLAEHVVGERGRVRRRQGHEAAFVDGRRGGPAEHRRRRIDRERVALGRRRGGAERGRRDRQVEGAGLAGIEGQRIELRRGAGPGAGVGVVGAAVEVGQVARQPGDRHLAEHVVGERGRVRRCQGHEAAFVDGRCGGPTEHRRRRSDGQRLVRRHGIVVAVAVGRGGDCRETEALVVGRRDRKAVKDSIRELSRIEADAAVGDRQHIMIGISQRRPGRDSADDERGQNGAPRYRLSESDWIRRAFDGSNGRRADREHLRLHCQIGSGAAVALEGESIAGRQPGNGECGGRAVHRERRTVEIGGGDDGVGKIEGVARGKARERSCEVGGMVEFQCAEAIERDHLRVGAAELEGSAAADRSRTGAGDRRLDNHGPAVRRQCSRVDQLVVDRERAASGGFEQPEIGRGVAGVDDDRLAARIGIDGAGGRIHQAQVLVTLSDHAAAADRVVEVDQGRAGAGLADDQVDAGRAEHFDHAAAESGHRSIDDQRRVVEQDRSGVVDAVGDRERAAGVDFEGGAGADHEIAGGRRRVQGDADGNKKFDRVLRTRDRAAAPVRSRIPITARGGYPLNRQRGWAGRSPERHDRLNAESACQHRRRGDIAGGEARHRLLGIAAR